MGTMLLTRLSHDFLLLEVSSSSFGVLLVEIDIMITLSLVSGVHHESICSPLKSFRPTGCFSKSPCLVDTQSTVMVIHLPKR